MYDEQAEASAIEEPNEWCKVIGRTESSHSHPGSWNSHSSRLQFSTTVLVQNRRGCLPLPDKAKRDKRWWLCRLNLSAKEGRMYVLSGSTGQQQHIEVEENKAKATRVTR